MKAMLFICVVSTDDSEYPVQAEQAQMPNRSLKYTMKYVARLPTGFAVPNPMQPVCMSHL